MGSQVLIYNKSCTDMREIPKRSISLVVTSPPYFDLKDYKDRRQLGKGQSYEAFLASMKKVFKECIRVLDGNGKLVINTGDILQAGRKYERHQAMPVFADYITMLRELGMTYYCNIIWAKMATKPIGPMSGSCSYPTDGLVALFHEYIIVFKKRGKRTLPLDANKKEASKLHWKEWCDYHTGIWTFPGEQVQASGHPAPFPIQLPLRIIRMFSYVGDTVLDPFMGTGTTAIAAMMAERCCYGYETTKKFVDMANERIRQHEGNL